MLSTRSADQWPTVRRELGKAVYLREVLRKAPTDPARELRRLRTELRRAEEEIARLIELLSGRHQEIRVLREKLAAKGLNVRTT